MKDQKEFILQGNLRQVMWQTSWPAVVAIVLYGVNNFLDAIFVGHLIGNKALAAVGMAYPLSQITLGFGRLVGVGSSAALSIWLGSNEKEKLYICWEASMYFVFSFRYCSPFPLIYLPKSFCI
jgi:Na+-driven multidrug efflux pump